jgi:anti-sigma regulatory factor (Ser/Thr protein kinase)
MEPTVTRDGAFGTADDRQAEIGPMVVNIDSLASLRAAVADHGRRCGMGDTAVGDLIMVANELATNVVRHGGGVGRMVLWHRDKVVICQVSDDGPGMFNTADIGANRIETTSVTGRGIWLIRQVANGVEIDTNERGTTVTVSMLIE